MGGDIAGRAIRMGQNVAQKPIGSHLADGEMSAGSEIGLRIDQTLTQDATGTMVMLELEALGLVRVRTQVWAGGHWFAGRCRIVPVLVGTASHRPSN